MKIVATNDREIVPVKIYHWWPGKQWKHGNPIPSVFVRMAEERGTKYMTMAIARVMGDIPYWAVGHSWCCPRDCPSREMGRNIALGRLRKSLAEHGWRLNIA